MEKMELGFIPNTQKPQYYIPQDCNSFGFEDWNVCPAQ